MKLFLISVRFNQFLKDKNLIPCKMLNFMLNGLKCNFYIVKILETYSNLALVTSLSVLILQKSGIIS